MLLRRGSADMSASLHELIGGAELTFWSAAACLCQPQYAHLPACAFVFVLLTSVRSTLLVAPLAFLVSQAWTEQHTLDVQMPNDDSAVHCCNARR